MDFEEEEFDTDERYDNGSNDSCSICSRGTIGEGCNQCGRPLCPMCFETGGGFCKIHPDDNYQPYTGEQDGLPRMKSEDGMLIIPHAFIDEYAGILGVYGSLVYAKIVQRGLENVTVGQLCQELSFSRPTVIKQITILQNMGFVERKNLLPEHIAIRLDEEAWNEIRRAVFKRDNFTCAYCQKRGGKLECDHILPIAKGGSNDMENLTTSCKACNRSKGSKILSR